MVAHVRTSLFPTPALGKGNRATEYKTHSSFSITISGYYSDNTLGMNHFILKSVIKAVIIITVINEYPLGGSQWSQAGLDLNSAFA